MRAGDICALKETFLVLQALPEVCSLPKLSFLIFLLNYMECYFLYVSGDMTCIHVEDIV